MATVTTTTESQEHGVISVLRPERAHVVESTTTAGGRTLESVTIDDPPSNAADERQYPQGSRFWGTTISICMILILGGLDANIVATAVPAITDHFHTVQDVGWYSSAFRLCTCSFQFLFGKLYKLYSIKKVFMLANAIFLVGSLLCATATSSGMFVVGRAVAGLGFAGELAGCFAVTVESLPMNRRPVFMGTMACVESCAIIAAPVIGGVLTQTLGWRWCFWINLPIGAVSFLTFFFLFRDPQDRPDSGKTFLQKMDELDLVSNCIFIPALTALFIALSWAGVKYPWSDGKVVGLLFCFAVLLSAFLYNQYRRGDRAALPWRIISHRNVLAGFIFTTCANSMTNVLEYYLPTYYQIVRGNSPGESGVKMIPIIVGMMLGLFLHGIGTTTTGYYTPFMIFASICMPIAAGLMTTYSLDTTLVQIIFYSGFAGFSSGIGFQGSQSAVQTSLEERDVAMGTGVILFGQSFGPAVSIAIAQVIFTNQLASNLQALVPGLNAAIIEDNGLSELKNHVAMQHWGEVAVEVERSLTTTWYLTVALGCTTLVGSLLMEWKSVKQKQS